MMASGSQQAPHRAPESCQPTLPRLPINRQAMANAPVLVMPWAIAADLARAVISPDHLAEPARVIIALRIVGRRVAKIARAEMVAMMEVGASRPDIMMPDNSRRGKTIAAATMECRGCAKTAAAKYGAASAETTAMNGCATTAEAAAVKSRAATPEAAATATKTTTTAAATMAVAASDFSRQSVRGIFRRWHGTGIDQRHSLGALPRRGREQQHRSRKTEAAKRAPRIWNVQHA